MEARPEQVRIAFVQGFAVGAVHEDGALGGQVEDRVHEVARGGAVQGGDASEVDAPAAAVAEAGDAERLAGALRHRGGGPADHLDQRLSHGAETGDEQVHLPQRPGLEKGPVQGLEGRKLDGFPDAHEEVQAVHADFQRGDARGPERFPDGVRGA